MAHIRYKSSCWSKQINPILIRPELLSEYISMHIQVTWDGRHIVHQKCVFVGIKYEVHVGFWCILGCSSIPSAFCTEVKSCVWKCLLVKEWVRKECLREKHIRFIQSHQLLAWWPPHMKVRPALQPQWWRSKRGEACHCPLRLTCVLKLVNLQDFYQPKIIAWIDNLGLSEEKRTGWLVWWCAEEPVPWMGQSSRFGVNWKEVSVSLIAWEWKRGRSFLAQIGFQEEEYGLLGHNQDKPQEDSLFSWDDPGQQDGLVEEDAQVELHGEEEHDHGVKQVQEAGRRHVHWSGV